MKKKKTNKTKQTNKQTNGLNSENIESLPAAELDHLLSNPQEEWRTEKGEEYEPDIISGFQRRIKGI